MAADPTFDEFRDQLAARVPGFPGNANVDFDLSRHGLLDHAQRAAVRHAVLALQPALDQTQLDTATSLGELHRVVSASSSDANPLNLQRGSYATARVSLRPFREQDLPQLYEAALAANTAFRWRFRGRTPSPEAFRSHLFNQVSAQFIVESVTTGNAIGIVSAYDEDLQNRHAKFAFQRTSAGEGSGGEMIEAVATFVSYLFDNFPFRKLYADLPEYNLYLIEALVESILTVEGRLTDYYYYNEQYWDLLIVSLSREEWNNFLSGFGLEDVRPARHPR